MDPDDKPKYYMSITFMEIDLDQAEAIIMATRNLVPGKSFSVHYDTPLEDDGEDLNLNVAELPLCKLDDCPLADPHSIHL